MPRRTKAEILAAKAARAARLDAPLLANGGTGVSAEQRLADIRAQRLEAMQALAKYKSEHHIEFFKPHVKQQQFINAALDPSKSTLAFIAGNRTGKTEVVMALTVAFALGRLPWVPKPKPFTFPNPLSISLAADGTVIVTHLAATHTAAQSAWTALHPPELTGSPVPPMPGAWQLVGDSAVGRFPQGSAKVTGTYDHLRSLLQAAPDPAALRFKPPVKIRVFGEKTDTLAEVQNPKLKKFIPPEALALTKKGQTGVVEHYLFNNGSSIDLLTYQQDPASMEGWDGHLCVFDEPPPRQVYIANVRGLVDHKGIALFSMTPLKEAWVSDEIANNPDPSFFTVTASSYDNPYVDKGALDAFFSKLSEDELATRRDGKFLHLQGLVFKDFDKQHHVIRPFKPDRNYTVYVSIDTHPRTPHALVFVAVDQRNRFFVFKDIFQNGTPQDVAKWVLDVHDNVHPIELALIDPSSKGDTNRGESTFDIIENRLVRAGIPLEPGSKDLSGGILLMQDALLSANGIPSLFVTSDCQRTLFEFPRYTWDEYRGGADKSMRTPKNKPRDIDDHALECIRRLVQLPATFVDPAHRARLNEPQRWTPIDPYTGY